jgi:hypothetical protein
VACHALPHADAVARLWWRALTACLTIQVGQALAVESSSGNSSPACTNVIVGVVVEFTYRIDGRDVA